MTNEAKKQAVKKASITCLKIAALRQSQNKYDFEANEKRFGKREKSFAQLIAENQTMADSADELVNQYMADANSVFASC